LTEPKGDHNVLKKMVPSKLYKFVRVKKGRKFGQYCRRGEGGKRVVN